MEGGISRSIPSVSIGVTEKGGRVKGSYPASEPATEVSEVLGEPCILPCYSEVELSLVWT